MNDEHLLGDMVFTQTLEDENIVVQNSKVTIVMQHQCMFEYMFIFLILKEEKRHKPVIVHMTRLVFTSIITCLGRWFMVRLWQMKRYMIQSSHLILVPHHQCLFE